MWLKTEHKNTKKNLLKEMFVLFLWLVKSISFLFPLKGSIASDLQIDRIGNDW